LLRACPMAIEIASKKCILLITEEREWRNGAPCEAELSSHELQYHLCHCSRNLSISMSRCFEFSHYFMFFELAICKRPSETPKDRIDCLNVCMEH
jgi:hypothetical protein